MVSVCGSIQKTNADFSGFSSASQGVHLVMLAYESGVEPALARAAVMMELPYLEMQNLLGMYVCCCSCPQVCVC